MWQAPFHDGSPLYLPEPPTELGDEFDVFLRVPRDAGATRVLCRQVLDGEPFTVTAELDRSDEHADWWRATLTQHNPVVNYRFLTDTGPNRYRWITAAGQRDHDPPDSRDFRSSIHPGAPEWVYRSTAYQIFPDRFARGSADPIDSPAWSRAAKNWDELPSFGGVDEPLHFFGGDLLGIEQRLDYLSELGIDLLYLTPVFPAPSNHRYNADTFDRVDPLLGGDQALASLATAAHQRGMRIIGDITTNHTGSHHEWFEQAQLSATQDEASYYYFNEHPDDYVAWLGVRSLPKLDYRSDALRRRMITDPDSPVRRYLADPFGLDGWRVDVANMTGRHADVDLNAEIAELMERTMAADRPDAFLVGEHFHDFTEDLRPTGWQGVMNYAGFSGPLWQWLSSANHPMDGWLGVSGIPWPRLPGTQMVAAMQNFANAPWQQRRASLVMIDSHDTPRIRSITGSTAATQVAAAAMFTTPGVPMIWMGSEIGLTGTTGEDGRRTMPWGHPEIWDSQTRQVFQQLIRLRQTRAALREGSMRWLHADSDCVVFVRELPGETLLVHLARGPVSPVTIPGAAVSARPGDYWQQLYPHSSTMDSARAIALQSSEPAAAVYVLKSSPE